MLISSQKYSSRCKFKKKRKKIATLLKKNAKSCKKVVAGIGDKGDKRYFSFIVSYEDVHFGGIAVIPCRTYIKRELTYIKQVISVTNILLWLLII